LEYNPYSPEVQADPYPLYKRLRDEAPVYHNEKLRFWALSRFEDVWSATLDWRTFSSSHGPLIEEFEEGSLSIISMDPPVHTLMRNLISKGFTPRRIGALEPAVRQIAVDYLDQLVGSGGFDVCADFASKFPLDVISELVGVPREDRDAVRRWFDLTPNRDPVSGEITPEAKQAIGEIFAYFAGLIGKKRAQPEDDLLSLLVSLEIEEGGRKRKLADQELIDLLFLVGGAGNETTTRLIANGMWLLDRHPDQRAMLLREPSLIPGAIEEMLRYLAPSQYQGRFTLRPASYHGQLIPENQRVILITGSAGRDEREFDDPDRFDILRRPERSLYFGLGHHVCLGKSLARQEARIAFEELLRRFPDYRVVPESLRRTTSGNTQGLSRIDIRI
jgi:cytochrome P450